MSHGAVLGFLPLPGEPDLRPLLERLLAAGRIVALPAILPESTRSMRLLALERPEELRSVRPGPRGTWEPDNAREMGVQDLSVILTPGLAFTRRGERLGRGGGYFDTLLARRPPHASAIGVAFECQIVDSIPLESHDATVDWLCTERGPVRTP